jgi:hypothetical protein
MNVRLPHSVLSCGLTEGSESVERGLNLSAGVARARGTTSLIRQLGPAIGVG